MRVVLASGPAALFEQFHQEFLGCKDPGDATPVESDGWKRPLRNYGTSRFERRKSLLDIANFITQVMQPAAALCKEPGDRRTIPRRLYQLNLAAIGLRLQESDFHSLVRIFKDRAIPVCAQRCAKSLNRSRNFSHHEADVV